MPEAVWVWLRKRYGWALCSKSMFVNKLWIGSATGVACLPPLTQQIVYTIFQSMKFKTLIPKMQRRINYSFKIAINIIMHQKSNLCYLKFPIYNKIIKKHCFAIYRRSSIFLRFTESQKFRQILRTDQIGLPKSWTSIKNTVI